MNNELLTYHILLEQDTPDFFDENSEYGKNLDVMDGVLGSQAQNANKKRSTNPGVEGAVSMSPPSVHLEM